MTKQAGMGAGLYVGGVDLSGDIGSLARIAGGNTPLVVTDITQSAESRLGGERTGGLDFTSWFNPAAGRSHKTLSALPRTDVQVLYRHNAVIGGPAAACQAVQINYDPNRGQDGSFTQTTTAESNGYGLEWGVLLTAGTRTDTTATSPATGLDQTAATAFGAQAYLQVMSVTGTSVTVTIQDSADNSAFTTITGMTFTAVNGAATSHQRLATLNTATIRRYIRVITTGTFTNAQFVVMFNRNEVAGVVF